MKRIVICCDGTSNKPNARHVTNVVKVARGIAGTSPDGATAQVVFYDPGVGSQGFKDSITGGAFGQGLSRNIQQAYRFIVLNYAPGDELFLFGFSRGAFTVRSLSGLISKFGVLEASEVQRIQETMNRYRDGEGPSGAKTRDVDIKFLGVWDTVGAMGVQTNRLAGALGWWAGSILGNVGRAFSWVPTGWTPDHLRREFAGAGRAISRRFRLPRGRYAFNDTSLSKQVKNGYHALAIDERRPVFDVVLWNKKPNPDQQIKQVWFAGVHTEVGGGTPNEGTSAVALEWMADRAKDHELAFTPQFDAEVARQLVAPRRSIAGSPPGPWRFAGRLWRTIGASDTGTECVHPTAIERFCGPQSKYAPPNLKAYMDAEGIDCSQETDGE